MSKCVYCGTDNPDTFKFCSNCGAPLTPPQAAMPQNQPPSGYVNNPFEQMNQVQSPVSQAPFPPSEQPRSLNQHVQSILKPTNVANYNQNDVFCLIGFILSLLSIVQRYTVLLALILSIIGVIRVSHTGQKGRKLAIAGIIISALSIAVYSV